MRAFIGGGDLHAAFLLEELAVLFEREVGVGPRLGGQALLQRLALGRGRAGDRLGVHPAGLATLLLPSSASVGPC